MESNLDCHRLKNHVGDMNVGDMNVSNMIFYRDIAQQFSNTRYKVWPAVQAFIDSFTENTINGDIGCGNGKNMTRPDVKFKGMDLTEEFVEICKKKSLDVIQGNILNIPFEDLYFDNIICIAVIHHLDKKENRIKAISELLRITKEGGKIMIYVWAFEQPENSKRKFTSQDELVPFKTKTETYYRYYHLYVKDELEEEIRLCSLEYNYKYNIIKNDYEYGNWYIIIVL